MSQIRATVEKELLALLISLGPNVPNMLQEFASGLLIHFQCLWSNCGGEEVEEN